MMPRQNLLLPGLTLIESHFERRHNLLPPNPSLFISLFFSSQLCQLVCLSIYLTMPEVMALDGEKHVASIG